MTPIHNNTYKGTMISIHFSSIMTDRNLIFHVQLERSFNDADKNVIIIRTADIKYSF